MADKHSKNTGRTVLRILLALAIFGALFIVALFFGIKNYNNAYNPESTEYITVEIASGSSTTKIANTLENAGIIQNANVFKLKTKFNKLDGKYQAGTYILSPSITMNELMQALQNGKNPEFLITFKEGLRVWEVADIFVENGLCKDREEFYSVLSEEYDFDFLPETGYAVLDVPAYANRMEGYLFPETYKISETATAREVIEMMLSQFQKVIEENDIESKIPEGYTLNQIINLASIIEKEAGVDEERAKISGVLWNRLNIGMRLQTCASVRYDLGDDTFDTTRESIFNTYLHAGITPGAICSPGIDCIIAAVEPQEHDYFYYVLIGDGSHRSNFAKTYEEHLKNVEIYNNNPYDY